MKWVENIANYWWEIINAFAVLGNSTPEMLDDNIKIDVTGIG
jgi:hypothetical protein